MYPHAFRVPEIVRNGDGVVLLTSRVHGSPIWELACNCGFADPTRIRILQVGFSLTVNESVWHVGISSSAVIITRSTCVRFVKQSRLLEAYAAIAQNLPKRHFVFKMVDRPPRNKSDVQHLLFHTRTTTTFQHLKLPTFSSALAKLRL